MRGWTVAVLQAQYFIPLAGMLLGNATSGVSVGLSTATTQLAEGRDAVEALLARGATRWEACQPLISRAVLLGIMPTVRLPWGSRVVCRLAAIHAHSLPREPLLTQNHRPRAPVNPSSSST